MIFKKLVINNFLPYGENISVDLSNHTFSLIYGQNEDGDANKIGKSALIEAITWCLWGSARGTKSKPAGDHLIRDGCNKMFVSVEVGDHLFERSRVRNKSTQFAIYDKNGDFVGGQSIQATNDIALEMLGISYDLFLHTFYLKTGGANNFVKLDPASARDKVAQMLNLSAWNERRKFIKPIIKGLNEEHLYLSGTMSGFHNYTTNDVSTINADIVRLNAKKRSLSTKKDELSKFISDKKDEVSDAQTRFNEYDEMQTMVNEINLNLSQCRDFIDENEGTVKRNEAKIDPISKELELVEKQIADADAKISSVQSLVASGIKDTKAISMLEKKVNQSKQKEISLHNKISGLTASISSLQETLDGLRDISGVCPIISSDEPVNCDSLITWKKSSTTYLNQCQKVEGEIEELMVEKSGLEEESGEALEELRELEEEYDSYGSVVSDLEGNQNMVDALSNTRSKLIDRRDSLINNINKAMSESAEYASKLAEAREYIKENAPRLKKLKSELNDVDISDVKSILEEFDEAVKEADAELIGVVEQIGSIKNKIENLSIRQEEMTLCIKEERDVTQKFNDNDSNLKCHRLLDKVFVDIQHYVIKSIVPEISTIANDILDCANVGMSIEILLHVETKTSGNIISKFKINAVDVLSGLKRSSDGLSESEEFWISFAVRIALYVACTRRINVAINTLIIDEGLGKLSDHGRQKLLDVLLYIVDKYKIEQLFLITHTDINVEFDKYGSTILIENENGISRIVT